MKCNTSLLMRSNLDPKELAGARLHPDFVPANDEGHLTTPRVDEAGPAAVHGDVLAVSRAETNRGVIERLTYILQDCWRQREGKVSQCERQLSSRSLPSTASWQSMSGY